MKKWKILYTLCFFAICLIPLCGLLLGREESSAENRDLAALPSVYTEEEGINREWLSQLGDYFQEHFAFRNELVTANALIQGRILGVSTASGVIQGTGGWLYYKDSLGDFLGTERMSRRSLFNLAHTMGMTERTLAEKGVKFVFAVAPNKNSLYGEHMPYYDSLKVTEENNLKRLKSFLEAEKVTYADLYGLFREKEEVLYHMRDSHWNNQGAAMAADQILTVLGKDHVSYEGASFALKKDYLGDLDQMLYPAAMTPENEVYFDQGPVFSYVEEVESNFAPRVSTVNEEAEGSAVVYRDSFGNALLPFLAEAYGAAYFSRGVPYQLSDVETHQADTVMIVRAERFLPEMAQSPPAMEAEAVEWSGEIAEKASDGVRDLGIMNMGLLKEISGRILPQYLEADSQIFVRLNGGKIYEAFPRDVNTPEGVDDGGFCLYVNGEELLPEGSSAEFFIKNGNTLELIYKDIIREEQGI